MTGSAHNALDTRHCDGCVFETFLALSRSDTVRNKMTINHIHLMIKDDKQQNKSQPAYIKTHKNLLVQLVPGGKVVHLV